ncbi:MAG: hypothetical protein ACREK8_03360 [Gemmatimonadales bacterium]
MTELAAPQISSLMEALPGIAAVLRSPVANAMVALSRSAADLEEFQFAHAEELLRFGVRRNLLTPEEVDKVLDELREVVSKRPAKPAPPPVRKIAKPEGPKVPHRPKGIQLKPSTKPPVTPYVAPKPPIAVTKPVKPAKPMKPIKAVKKPAPVKRAAATRPTVKSSHKPLTAKGSGKKPSHARPAHAKASRKH